MHLIYRKIEADAMHLIYRKIEADAMHLAFEKDKKAIFNWLVKRENCESKKLGDVCDKIKTGKNKPKDDKKGTLYPYYGTGGITGYTDEYLIDGEYLLCARNGSVGQSFLIKGKSYPSDHMFIINNITINIIYLYYSLKWYNCYEKISTGGGIQGITVGSLSNIIIQIPSKQKQQEIVDQIESINKQQETYKQYGDMLEKQITQIFETIDTTLFDIITDNSETNQNIINNNSDESETNQNIINEDEEQEEIIEKVKPKKTKSKKVISIK